MAKVNGDIVRHTGAGCGGARRARPSEPNFTIIFVAVVLYFTGATAAFYQQESQTDRWLTGGVFFG